MCLSLPEIIHSRRGRLQSKARTKDRKSGQTIAVFRRASVVRVPFRVVEVAITSMRVLLQREWRL